MSKIISITATIPVTGQSYTDLRPTIEADSLDDYRELLAAVGQMAGNNAFVQRMTNNQAGFHKITTDNGSVLFDPATHTYKGEDGSDYRSGSVWSHQFEVPFDAPAVANRLAEKRMMSPEDIVAGWELKSEVSTTFGTAVHKAIECAVKYNEMPNNPYLATLVQDYLDMTQGDTQYPEQFVMYPDQKMCGVIDMLVDKGDKKCVIRDFKTGDIHKKASLTPAAKDLFPGLKSEIFSLYHLQLSFYAYILAKLGYKVVDMEVWHIENDTWKVENIKPLNIEEAL